MQEQVKGCVAFTGNAVNGSMNVNELASALLALSNLVSEANQILNHDHSKIEVRISAHFERGSFEMSLELIRDLPAQIKFFLFDSSISLNEILGAIGLFCTISGGNFLEIFRFVRGRKISKVEKADKDTVKIFIDEESREFSIGAWQLFKSEKARRHMEGLISPLNKDGIEAVEFRDANNKEVMERITEEESAYFAADAAEDLEQLVSSQKLKLRIVNVSFERDLKWRFDDGETKFYAKVEDEEFWSAVEAGRLSFTCGSAILAEIETTQQFVKNDLRKTTKIIKKVLEISQE